MVNSGHCEQNPEKKLSGHKQRNKKLSQGVCVSAETYGPIGIFSSVKRLGFVGSEAN